MFEFDALENFRAVNIREHLKFFLNEDIYSSLNFTEVKLWNMWFNQKRVEFVCLGLEHLRVLAFFPVENFTSAQFHFCVFANQTSMKVYSIPLAFGLYTLRHRHLVSAPLSGFMCELMQCQF